MNKNILLAVIISLTFLYVGHVGYVMNKGVEHQILAATTADSYPLISNLVAKQFIKYGIMNSNKDQGVISYAIAGIGIGSNYEDTIEVVDYLILNGADVNYLRQGMAPLHEAILFGKPKLVLDLLDRGANLEKTIDRENSNIHGMNSMEFAKFLIARDKDKFSKVLHAIEKRS